MVVCMHSLLTYLGVHVLCSGTRSSGGVKSWTCTGGTGWISYNLSDTLLPPGIMSVHTTFFLLFDLPYGGDPSLLAVYTTEPIIELLCFSACTNCTNLAQKIDKMKMRCGDACHGRTSTRFQDPF